MPKYNDFDLDLQTINTVNPPTTCSVHVCKASRFSCPMLELTKEGDYQHTCAL